MNTGKIILAGLIGGIVAFMFGFLTYGLILDGFFSENAGTARGVERGEDILMIPLILGHLAWGLLLAFSIGKLGKIDTFSQGAIAGAIVGFLCTAAAELVRFGTTHLTTLKVTLVNILVLTLISGIIGGIIGWIYSTGIKDELFDETLDSVDSKY